MSRLQSTRHGIVVAGLFALCFAAQLSSQTPPALKLAASESAQTLTVSLSSSVIDVEVGKTLALSAVARTTRGLVPVFEWKTSAGTIITGPVQGEVDFQAPTTVGKVTVTVTAKAKGQKDAKASLVLNVLPEGALKPTARIVITVDANSLHNVWVDAKHTAENFVAPLRIKGTFRFDPDSGEGFAGGSWPLYDMYDDGTHGDEKAGDNVWTLAFNFEKTDSPVYYAFDDANTYRVGFESGLAYRLKLAWKALSAVDDSGEITDANNLGFIPLKDQVIRWTEDSATRSKIHDAK